MLVISLFSKKVINQYFTSFFLILVLALIASSRVLMQDPSDDLTRYYKVYLLAKDAGLMDYLSMFNREILFQIYNWILFQFIGEVHPRLYLFFMVFPTVLFGGLALYKISPPEYKFLVTMLCFLTPSMLTLETQLIRQTMSIMVVIYAFTIDSKFIRRFLLFSSFLLHSVAIVFIILLHFIPLFRKEIIRSNGIILFVFLIAAFFLHKFMISNFDELVFLISSIPNIGYKVSFLKAIDFENIRLGTILVFSIIVFLFSVFIFFSGVKRCSTALIARPMSGVEAFIFINFIFLFIALSFYSVRPLAERFTMYISSFSPFFFFYILSKYSIKQKYLIEMLFVSLNIVLFIANSMTPSSFAIFNGVAFK